MFCVVELRLQVADELLLLVAERPRAADERTRLDDEAWRHAMKGHSVVHTGLREAQELADVSRRLVWKELDRDRSGARIEDGAVRRELPGRFRGERFRLGWRRIANGDALDLDAFGRQPFFVNRRLRDFLNDIHPVGHVAEDSVLAIETWLIHDDDEE